MDPDTVVYLEHDRAYYKSDAILKISRKLGGLLLIFQIGYIMPRKCRDSFYDFIARNRYRWFGKRRDCMVPDGDYKDRFLG
jgi:predicted DCC family thiol-disulfide oxidoreductase YuxK